MKEDAPALQPVQKDPTRLKLYVYGSCQSDQYYHPRGDSESKRPICLSDIQNFNFNEDEDEQDGDKIIPNPLFKADIYKITCGALHTIVLTTEGSVFSFGCNDQGALGRQGLEKIPIRVPIDEPIHQISAGDNHSMFANCTNGSIYFTGTYKYMRGQSISQEKVTAPIRYSVRDLQYKLKNKPIQKIVSGSNHSAVLVGGKVFIRGQCETHAVGRRISSRHKVENSLAFDGVGLNHVEDLWCGGYHSIAKVNKHGTWHYYAWGLNKHGQLGLRNYKEYGYPQELKQLQGKNVVSVAAGTNFTILMDDNSELYGCGQNDYGQLGLGQGYSYVDSEEELQQPQQQQKKEEHQEQPQPNREESNIHLKEQKKPENQEGNQNVPHSTPAKKVEEEQNKELIKEEGENKPVEQKIQSPVEEVKQAEPAQSVQQVQQKKEPQIKKAEEKPIINAPLPIINAPLAQQAPLAVEPEQPKFKQKDMYIKSLKSIPTEEKVQKISSGTDFTFAWNDKSVYSWGVGMNYVLLNGQQDDEYSPFKVRPKIINEHTIWDVQAGAQHVAYLSFPTQSEKPKPQLSQKALEHVQAAKKPLKKKKRS